MERNAWHKSSRSGSNGQCVEVRDRGTHVDVRDSKAPAAGVLTFDPTSWAAFAASMKSGGIRP